tara:strand:- start:291 stop:407 length:117 start_codon:yes stop_codon:yes gene_type:complete
VKREREKGEKIFSFRRREEEERTRKEEKKHPKQTKNPP